MELPQPAITYVQVLRLIDSTQDLHLIPKKDLDSLEKIIRTHIAELQVKGDDEDLAIAHTYLLIFLLQSGRLTHISKIRELYETIRKFFLSEDHDYHQKSKVAKNKMEQKILYNQMLVFYKMTVFYLTYLEKVFSSLDLSEFVKDVQQERVHFLQRQQLMEGNISKLLSYTRMSISLFFRKYIFFYGLLTAIGIVLLWHGLWGIDDWIIAQLGLSDSLYPYLATSLFGVIILYILGVFLNQTIGEEGGASGVEIAQTEDVKKIEKLLKKKRGQKTSA